MSVTGEGDPPKLVRVFWVAVMGAISVILINIGEGSIDAIQSFIIITAVPISIIMLPVIWTAPAIAHKLAKEQGIIKAKEKNTVFKFLVPNQILKYTGNDKEKD
jgi:glycine betaine transporter